MALVEAVSQIVPDQDQTKLKNLETVLTGLLLGQDLRTTILPRLGPGVIAYVESQPETLDQILNSARPLGLLPPFAQVLVVSLRKGDRPSGASGAAAVTTESAIENALRTVLSLAALDEKRNNARSQITTRLVAGVNVTTLDTPIPFAYAVDAAGSRVVLGTSPEAVVRYLEAASNPAAGNRFRRFKPRAFPEDDTFFCVDLKPSASSPAATRTGSSRFWPTARTVLRRMSIATFLRYWPWPGCSRPRISPVDSSRRPRLFIDASGF